jgi:hypothetical protein
VLVRERNAEERHDLVADELVDGAAEPLDDRCGVGPRSAPTTATTSSGSILVRAV